jgi:hypothetical protein
MRALRLAGVRAGAGVTLSMLAMTGCLFHHSHRSPVATAERVPPSDSTPTDGAAAAPAATPAAAPALPSATTTGFARTVSMSTDRGSRALVRKGEHYASPFIARRGGPKDAGEIVGSSEVPAVAWGPRSPYEIDELLYIRMPSGVTPVAGSRIGTFELGPELERFGQVVIPTGELVVVAPGGPGEATTARLVKMYGEVDPGQLVLPLDTPAFPPVGQRATAVEDGVRASVLYVSSDPVLPSIGYFVVLSASERDNVHLGDQFTLFRARTRDDVSGLMLPEQQIATTQVVRVGPVSSTAVVLSETMPVIQPGAPARLTARMP